MGRGDQAAGIDPRALAAHHAGGVDDEHLAVGVDGGGTAPTDFGNDLIKR